jgi:hypothetical protein
MYWSHCAVTLSSLGLLFFFFVAIVALFFLTDIIFHFCGVCVQRLLLLFLLLFDVTGLAYAVVCFLTSAPPLLDTVDMKRRFEACHYVERSISRI